MEGNLPVSSSCLICKRTCGSVMRLQDWRCLWCRATAHTACRPFVKQRCPLGSAQLSVIPPTSVHSIGIDEAWDVVKPNGSYSPLLVFVNSKSGDNQGVKFLRRFKQILNPAQVFDLVSAGPGLGLRLFRHFEPFRILVCSGDGSVGWVLSEIDRMDMIVSLNSTCSTMSLFFFALIFFLSVNRVIKSMVSKWFFHQYFCSSLVFLSIIMYELLNPNPAFPQLS